MIYHMRKRSDIVLKTVSPFMTTNKAEITSLIQDLVITLKAQEKCLDRICEVLRFLMVNLLTGELDCAIEQLEAIARIQTGGKQANATAAGVVSKKAEKVRTAVRAGSTRKSVKPVAPHTTQRKKTTKKATPKGVIPRKTTKPCARKICTPIRKNIGKKARSLRGRKY